MMRTNASLFPWAKKKVITNAARISREPWRIVAAIDEEELVCYQRLHGLWPKDDTPLELIAAILNGPVANVLLSASEITRDNLIREIKAIPLPGFRPMISHWCANLSMHIALYLIVGAIRLRNGMMIYMTV
jgi:hypothetical protein